jgi:hypothetical protein
MIRKPPFFQATWGDVTTRTPYRRPTLEAFAKWWMEFKNIKGLEDYEVNLVGSFCEKHFGHYEGIVKDLDIVLTGELQDEEQLKYIMSHGVSLGFKHKMLVDLSWCTEVSNFDDWKPFCKIRIGKTFSKILGDKAYANEYHGDEERKLDCGMWAFCFETPPNSWFKALHRYEKGQYEGISADVREMFN